MKKLLATNKFEVTEKYNTSPVGFTLVELLVVVSIIAILSMIGFAVLSSAQKGARDAVRRLEIDAVAKALETNFDNSTAKYAVLTINMFADKTIPDDIYTGTAKCGTGGTKWCEYCGRAVAGTAMTQGENSAAGCTTNGAKITTAIPATDTAFEVCATLETSPYFYCKVNQR